MNARAYQAAPEVQTANTLPASYQAGVRAFQAALLEIEYAQHRCIPESLPFGAATALPILRRAFEQHGDGDLAAGFWDAFACWIARPFEGRLPVAEGWDALSDLADEEDYERSFDSPCERATP